MSLRFSFILMATVATLALHSSHRHSECPRSRPVVGHTATKGQNCGISAIPPILTSPSVQNSAGGYPAVAHSWPWVVSIQYQDFILGTEWKHMCAGILVSPSVGSVLSAASPFNWLVILGPQNNSVLANVNTSVTIESFFGHSYYYQGNIKLSNDIVENAFTSTICVGEPVSFPIGYTDCFVVGWTNQGTNLTQAQVMLVSPEQYQKETGQKFGPSLAIAAVVISSSGFPSSVELGQPLMCRSWCNREDGQWFLLGVADGYDITKGRYDNKIYVRFIKYVTFS